MNREQMDSVARWVNGEGSFIDGPLWLHERLFDHQAPIASVPKGRPRFSQKGGAYTPKRTADFEKAVIDWATPLMWGRKPYLCPISVSIYIFSELNCKGNAGLLTLARMNVVTKEHGDLDNRAKAILDALNGIVFADDKQITRLVVERQYNNKAGFRITVNRSGLTLTEATEVAKLIRGGINGSQ